MLSLFYISYSLIDIDSAEEKVKILVEKSIESNKTADLTGALVFTGINFCQFLEGPDSAVLRLMDSIRRDQRHKDLWITYQEASTERRFANWSMAYNGGSDFVNGFLMDIIDSATEVERKKATEAVIKVMEEFAK